MSKRSAPPSWLFSSNLEKDENKSSSRTNSTQISLIPSLKKPKFQNISSSPSTIPFLELPIEVVVDELFKFLDIYWLFSVGRVVCREWNDLITNHLSGMELDVCLFSEDITSSFYLSAQRGSFSKCISSLKLLQLVTCTGRDRMKKKEFKKAVREEISIHTHKMILTDLLDYFECLENLDLSLNTIGERGAFKIVNCKNLQSLKSLDLSGSVDGVNIGNEGICQFITNTSKNLSNLIHLSLARNQLNQESLTTLIICDAFPNLKSLDLFGNKLDDDCIGFLSRAKNLLSNMEELNLSYNEYGSIGAEFIASSPYLSSLHTLSMAGKDLNFFMGASGVQSLFSSTMLSSLTSLNLSYNRISDIGAKYIFESSRLVNLIKLNLNSNQLTSRGVSYLSQSKILGNIKKLHLSYNQIGSYGAQIVCQKFKSLIELYMRGNNINNVGAKEISESGNLRNIVVLDLSLNKFGLEGLEFLSKSQTLPKYIVAPFKERYELIRNEKVEDIYSVLEENPSIIDITVENDDFNSLQYASFSSY